MVTKGRTPRTGVECVEEVPELTMSTRWNPFSELAAIERRMDRLFAQAFGAPAGSVAVEPSFHRLPVNVETAPDGYVITAPLPGFSQDEVEVSLAGELLTISARRLEDRSEQGATGGGYRRQEVATGNLYRQVALGREVSPEDLTAELENGVLSIRIADAPRSQPRRIPITTRSPDVLQPGPGSTEPEPPAHSA